MIEQGGQYRPIADALERVGRRSIEQLAGLNIAERRRAAFVVVGHRPLDAVDRIAGDCVALAQIIQQGAESAESLRRMLEGASSRVSRCLRQAMTSRHGAQLGRTLEPDQGRKITYGVP